MTICVICVNDEAVTHCRQLWNIAGDYLKSDKNSRQLLLAVDGCSVRQDIEILNLWEDFKKVVKFIDENFEWLNPLMEHITHKKLSLE